MSKKVVILTAALLVLLTAWLTMRAETTEHGTPQDDQEQLQFLQAHPEKCARASLSIEIRRDENTDTEKWLAIYNHFATLADACKKSETDNNDTQWINILGLHLPAIITLHHKDGSGIHGSVSVSINTENNSTSLTLEAEIHHDEIFNPDDWRAVVELVSTINSYEAARSCSPFIAQLFDLIDDPTIHGSIELTLN